MRFGEFLDKIFPYEVELVPNIEKILRDRSYHKIFTLEGATAKGQAIENMRASDVLRFEVDISVRTPHNNPGSLLLKGGAPHCEKVIKYYTCTREEISIELMPLELLLTFCNIVLENGPDEIEISSLSDVENFLKMKEV
jgi:hypothetical protein